MKEMTQTELTVLKFRFALLLVCGVVLVASLFFLSRPADETMATVIAVLSFWGCYKMYDDITDSLVVEEETTYEEPEELEDIVEFNESNLEAILTYLDDGDIDVDDARIKIMELLEE